jgi:AAA15 family ATPase/GTPase
MITDLRIDNFKSIKALQLSCRRVNLFIGDPNSGKSNILESLSLLNINGDLRDFIRFENVSQLFFDFDASKEISVTVNKDQYRVGARIDGNDLKIESYLGLNSPFLIKMSLKGEPRGTSYNDAVKLIPIIRFYKFKENIKFIEADQQFLSPPFGSNLPSIVAYNKDLRDQIQKILEALGYKLLYRPYDVHFEIYREQNGYSVSFPVSVISDTVKRMMFFLAVIESNSASAIVFEEPESNTFPLYIKYLAERIAAYNSNQFFITTHNPYFLQSIIEKTPSDDLSINLVEMENYQTKVTALQDRNVAEILGLNSDVFLNFDKVKNP